MTNLDIIREAVLKVLEETMEDQAERYDALPIHRRAGHLCESLCALREWLGPTRVAEFEYTIGPVPGGEQGDLAILREGEPLAMIVAPESSVSALVHAGNCHFDLLEKLERMLECWPDADHGSREAARQQAQRVVARARRDRNV